MLEWFQRNPESHNHKMAELWSYCNISKQGFHQGIARRNDWVRAAALSVDLILEARITHPGMGLRSIYEHNLPGWTGRDTFISVGVQEGLVVELERTGPRTTIVHPSANYPNLLHNMRVTDVNQLWTSDITYIRVADNWCYLVFILDVYSRRIVGHAASNNMREINNRKALKMALDLRGIDDYHESLIHHSDRGSQYVSHAYTDMLKEYGIQISMCKKVLENTHVERVNKTIKNQYLQFRDITNLKELKKWLDHTVHAYNYLKKHSSIGGFKPVEFEKIVKELPESSKDRFNVDIFTYMQNSDKVDPNQLCLPL